jgi:hypothetical protein
MFIYLVFLFRSIRYSKMSIALVVSYPWG